MFRVTDIQPFIKVYFFIIHKSRPLLFFLDFIVNTLGLDESDLSENEITSAASCPSTAEMAATNGSSQVSWFRSELARLKFDLQGMFLKHDHVVFVHLSYQEEKSENIVQLISYKGFHVKRA